MYLVPSNEARGAGLSQTTFAVEAALMRVAIDINNNRECRNCGLKCIRNRRNLGFQSVLSIIIYVSFDLGSSLEEVVSGVSALVALVVTGV